MFTTELEPVASSGLLLPAAPDCALASPFAEFQEDLQPPETDRAHATKNSKIMIVDDEPILIRVVRKYLHDVGYNNIISTAEAASAMGIIRQERPDVVLLDIVMPQVSGLDILQAMRQDARLRHVPVLILTATTDAQTKARALELGATDFLTKPVDPSDLVPRVRNALVAKAYQDRLESYAEELEQRVRVRTAELAASRQEIILCLGRAAEFRDNDTGHHIIRVGRYAGIIARALHFSEYEATCLELAAQLHDVGKIAVPDAVLKKPGSLEPEEFEVMQKHCAIGRNIIQRMPDVESNVLRGHAELGAKLLDVRSSPIMRMASRIALTHHEKWDGSGYPLGLASEDIPIEGRVTAVADVFDALTTKRPYKPALPLEKSFQIMEEKRGSHFDPAVLDAFFARRSDIVQVQIDFADMD